MRTSETQDTIDTDRADVAVHRTTRRGFELLDENSAGLELGTEFAALRKRLGYLPGHAAALAGNPLAWQAYESLNRLIARSSLSVTEKQLIMLTASRVNNCEYCMAAHSASAARQRLDPTLLADLRAGRSLADAKLEALRTFACALLEGHGAVDDSTFSNFLAAGYTRQQALDIVVALASKLLSNYATVLMQVETDPQDADWAWQLEG